MCKCNNCNNNKDGQDSPNDDTDGESSHDEPDDDDDDDTDDSIDDVESENDSINMNETDDDRLIDYIWLQLIGTFFILKCKFFFWTHCNI